MTNPHPTKHKTRKISKVIVTIVIISISIFLLSTTKVACQYFQNHIDNAMKPLTEQAQQMDKNTEKDYHREYNLKLLQRYNLRDSKLLQQYNLRDSKLFQQLVKASYKNSWLLYLQNYIAHVNSFIGRDFQAYQSFQKYHTYFSHILPKQDALKIAYWEIITARDSGQLGDCLFLMEDFLEQNQEGVLHDEVEEIQVDLHMMMPGHGIYDNNIPQIWY